MGQAARGWQVRAWFVALLVAALCVVALADLARAECGPVVRDTPADSPMMRFEPTARGVGRDMGVDSALLLRIGHVESRGDPRAVSWAGALGLLQQLRSWWLPGEDPFDPYQNIRKGAGILREAYERTGSWVEAVREYGGWWGYVPYIYETRCEP